MPAVLIAAEEAEVVNHLPMAPELFGLVAFGSLMVLLAVTYAFRSVGTRH